MIGILDRALGRVTMYRLVWMMLVALLLIALGYSSAGLIFSTPLELVASTAVAVVSTTVVSALMARVFRTRAHLESSMVTGLLIACLLFPTATLSGLAVIALVGAIAATSKFVLAWRGRHLMNPAAVAVLIIGITQLTAGAWWIASGVLWPWVVLASLLVVARVRRWMIFLVYVGVSGGISLWLSVQAGHELGAAAELVLTTYPFIFAGAFMLTEPLTLAPRRWQQGIIAVIAALVASVPFRFGVFSATPELGLVVGNLVAFAFALPQRRRLSLELTSTSVVAPGIAEYRFRSRFPLRFEPGQWLELELPHRADSRGTRRTFSIASAPGDGEIALATRISEKASSFKRTLAGLAPGSVVRATTVGGDFLLPVDPAAPVLMVAGGIGITPFASQLAALIGDSARDIVLVYAAARIEDVAYRELLLRSGVRVVLVSKEAPDQLPEGWSHVSGRLSAELLLAAVPDTSRRIGYVSGSLLFVDTVRSALRGAGARRVRTDAFAGY
ncbi:FAD-dependent oxidoreductase [Rathayibacter toxicus]|uniref:Oxidoreductase n=1 Tax=Rathayibacter toxicus TaxID=145458 RepID=A0A2S5Y6F0_9MICO|nr:hypothetical protein [Rathayibacter toxicus]PPH22701.1 oxidoreductase [Rathayibacter toxicus]PPH56905.1 oxidoreductase [Rathayibacter toxicus]PPH59595.1 oxidoreductase [Rathayibacter toxicus]PPH86825.1 oxidoreductase [Rathayibacter toxicus]PPI14546.1 oxidoreductase [Rathayibacter toxicus]